MHTYYAISYRPVGNDLIPTHCMGLAPKANLHRYFAMDSKLYMIRYEFGKFNDWITCINGYGLFMCEYVS